MCSYNKIFRRYPELHDIINNRFNSNLDFIIYNNYIKFLKYSCKCKYEFNILNIII